MAPNAVGTAQILQSNVTQNKMAPNAVGTAQILQSNVTLNKMAPKLSWSSTTTINCSDCGLIQHG